MGSWRKSTYSDANGGQCVETAERHGAVLVRDSANQTAGTLTFTADAWRRFTGTLK
jgi:hypothetical protein